MEMSIERWNMTVNENAGSCPVCGKSGVKKIETEESLDYFCPNCDWST